MSSPSISLKPRYNPLLWAQLRPSARPATAESSQDASPTIPLMPENKMNTSLRVVLHDTKSALEQFSDRLGSLLTGVEHARREIEKVNQCFADGHEKVLEELTSTVNRSQKGLLEALGSPAQAIVLDEVRTSQQETRRKLDLLEDKSELVQKQLHTISEQQGHILTALAGITPLVTLFKDSPHQQNQILSTLTSLTPVLPLVHGVMDQVKAYQHTLLALIDRSVLHLPSLSGKTETPTVPKYVHDASKMVAPATPIISKRVLANTEQRSDLAVPSRSTVGSKPISPGLRSVFEDTARAPRPIALSNSISGPVAPSNSSSDSNYSPKLPFSSDADFQGYPKDNLTNSPEEDPSRACKRPRLELLDSSQPRDKDKADTSPPKNETSSVPFMHNASIVPTNNIVTTHSMHKVLSTSPPCKAVSVRPIHKTLAVHPSPGHTPRSHTHKFPLLPQSKSLHAPMVPRSIVATTSSRGSHVTSTTIPKTGDTAAAGDTETGINPSNTFTPHTPGSFWKVQSSVSQRQRVKRLQGGERKPEHERELLPRTPSHRLRLVSPHWEAPTRATNGLTTPSRTTSGQIVNAPVPSNGQGLLAATPNKGGLIAPIATLTRFPQAIPPGARRSVCKIGGTTNDTSGNRSRSTGVSDGTARRGDIAANDKSAVTNGQDPINGGRTATGNGTHVTECNDRDGNAKTSTDTGAELTGLASYNKPLDRVIRNHSTRPTPQRILLDDIENEDVDIDLDWGDI